MPGTPHILPYITRAFAVNLQNLEARRPAELTRLNPGPILNHIADPDRCGRALKTAEQIVQKSGRGCFNHPTSVLKTSRDVVARVLAGIDGLRMPRAFRHAFADAGLLEGAIAREGMEYPVLVRIAGDHGGVSTIKVDEARDIQQVDN